MRSFNNEGKLHPTKEEKEKILHSYNMGITVNEIAEIFSFHPMTIYRWLREERGKSLERKAGSGRPSKIGRKDEDNLIKILKKPATKFGFETALWNTNRIRIVCKKRLNINLSRVSVWNFLKRIDYSSKKVQKLYVEADKKKRTEWMKKTVKKIRKIVEENNAILYFEDESNVSLSPVLGTSWTPKGESISTKVTGKRGSVAAISAISNDGRLIFSLHNSGKRFNAGDIIAFLKQMLLHHKRRHLVVVMEQAPCHTAKKVKLFVESQKKLHVFYIPSYSPDLNPDEKVWNHLKNIELKDHEEQDCKGLKRLICSKMKKMSISENTLMAIFRRCEYAHIYEF